MSEVTDSYNLVFKTDADKAASQVAGLSRTLDDMARSGEISSKGLNQASRGILSIEKALGQVSGASKSAVTGMTFLSDRVRELDKAMNVESSLNVLRGVADPVRQAGHAMSVTSGEARQLNAMFESMSASAKDAVGQVLAAAEAAQKVSKIAQDESASRARNRVPARPGGMWAQGQAFDTGSASSAKDTSWAREAEAVKSLNLAYDAHVQEFQKVQSAKASASQQTALYNQYLWDQDQAQQKAAASTQRLGGSLPTLRYALYDVSNTLAVTGGAMLGFSALSLKAAVDYERSFADVIRTNDQLMQSSVASARAFERFVQLSSELPTSFKDLSEIGTLAGQLGVATGRLEGFTRSTAMFSAVTGETVDTTATAFGRLDALLPDVKGNYDALGSSILNVGINSVATEGEVIRITTQLAGVGRQAGLTSDEVIGLSGALASVGVQPELARGTITRLFGQISRAVSTGSDDLEGFAAIAGATATGFSSKWKSAPMEAVLDVFRGIRDRGGEAESALRAVGITSSRDVPAILRLSQTMDSVLVPALKDAKDGFQDGTQLSENYGVIAETTASKIQILANNFQSLLAALGDSQSVLGAAVDTANKFLVWARELQKNPVTAFFSQFAVIAAGVLGTLTLLTAGAVRAGAGIIAFKTAMAEAGVTSTGLRANLTALTGTIAGVNAQSVTASGGLTRLTGIMGSAGLVSAALVAIPLAQWFRDWVAEVNGAQVDVETLAASLGTLDQGMSASAVEDFKNTITQAVESLGASTQTAADGAFIPIIGAYSEAIKNAGYEAETEFGLGLERMGEKGSSWWTTDLFTGDPTWIARMFDASYEEMDKFEEAFIQAWETAASETQKQAVLDAYQELEDQVVSAGGSAEDMAYNFEDFHNVVGDGVDTSLLAAEANQINEESVAALAEEMQNLVDDVFSSINAHYELQSAMSAVGEEFFKEGAAVAATGASMQDAIKAIVDQSAGAGSAAANLQVFFDYLVKGGFASASQLTHLSSVIAGLKSQAGGKIPAPTLAVPDFSGFQTGWDQASEKATQAMSRTGDAAERESQRAAKAAERAADQAAKAAEKAARESIRTFKDYASDLSAVWGRAFEIRFSGEQTLDAIKNSIQGVRDAAADSAKRVLDLRGSIRSLTADISGIKSDIGILEYYLKIAREYGDTKRATALEAELAKKRAELAAKTKDLSDKNKELKKEQESQNKTLVGNSQAARDNRKTIQDLVQQYQAHIEKLAASGMSQDQLAKATQRLKEDFIKQATQLGYNRSELSRYAKSFDDVRTAINKVPRNITVKANVNPAITAFNELQSRASKSMSGVQSRYNDLKSALSKGISVPISASNQGLIATLEAQANAAQKKLNSMSGWGNDNWAFTERTKAQRELNAILAQLSGLRGWQTGGYTGAGPASRVAGLAHKGEYVLRKDQVNQATGLPYASALGQLMGGLPSRSVAPSASPQTSGTPTVALSAGTIQAIAQATGKNIYLDGKLVAASTHNQNTIQNEIGAY